MALFALQYLEDSPELPHLAPQAVRDRLREAFARLPISLLLLGWNVPEPLAEVCADECQRAGAHLYRWHPLLTSDGTLHPRPEWQVIGAAGDAIPGFRGMPEFTFMCPNRPPVQEAIAARLGDVLRQGRWQGLFFDRIRFPSPAADPRTALGCFCEDCRQEAAQQGLDLEAVRGAVQRLASSPPGAAALVRGLLDPAAPPDGADAALLCDFLAFRARSITRFVRRAADQVRAAGGAVGLDCFSSGLAWMVGQSLGDLDDSADWIKIMSYGHTLGPAGMPFELLGLANWLVARGLAEGEALARLAQAARLPLPSNRARLENPGLASDALAGEIHRARAAGVRTLLAGIELVELEGVTHLSPAQIAADSAAFRAAGAEGLALSWDLWLIPLDRLESVGKAWAETGS